MAALVYWPDERPHRMGISQGFEILESGFDPPPPNLIPLLPVDDRSIACAVCVSQEKWCGKDAPQPGPAPCVVVRWHLDLIPADEQGALLDSDASQYLETVAAEFAARPGVMRRVHAIAEGYRKEYVAEDRRPRGGVQRPIQLACQNVIIGLATVQHEPRFDGLRVDNYLTCEAPHLAAHEANRAMLALVLCDAFQNGGTMEIRFGRDIPPALRRYARSLGLPAGEQERGTLTPEESRRLFMAVTPMPDDLRARCAVLMDRGVLAPERLCYTLMSGVWSTVELDFILATTPRAPSILMGGCDRTDRSARLAESETCRAALMVGMFMRRLGSQDKAAGGPEGVRVFEDRADRVLFTVLDSYGAVAVEGGSAMPWSTAAAAEPAAGRPMIVVPRGLPTPADEAILRKLAADFPAADVALLVPTDLADLLTAEVPCIRCPDGLAELDQQIEGRLRSLRIGRA
ncbi:MAG: hypothetical protein QME55_00050 [Brevundimonas sp.]|uniref:hypothetical protein n=1 Tax=Brevundimonas sp. TaxID=1871086 RepID=UPI002621D893|nr:hypothetical protein [Brevundimonas sp.]MDI6623094.1 hypothetical protein [Brevundimonas sp.]MDQ7812813.1 hypothetical protein [Brevundimonas sp.]